MGKCQIASVDIKLSSSRITEKSDIPLYFLFNRLPLHKQTVLFCLYKNGSFFFNEYSFKLWKMPHISLLNPSHLYY